MPGSDLLMKLNPWWCLTAGATAFETYRQLPADCADTDDKTKFTVHGWQLTVFPNYTIRVIRGQTANLLTADIANGADYQEFHTELAKPTKRSNSVHSVPSV